MDMKIKTKFGDATLNNYGYYRISTKKEGFAGMLLHRLILEDYLGCGIPSSFVVHHINEDKTDNRIENLEVMSRIEHIKLHHVGKKRTVDSCKNMSESKNNSGYYRVTKHANKTCKQGYVWRYTYLENGRHKEITSTNLNRLKEKVLDKGLIWEMI